MAAKLLNLRDNIGKALIQATLNSFRPTLGFLEWLWYILSYQTFGYIF